MEAITGLEQEHFLLRFVWSAGDRSERCVDWAVARLANDEEGDDLEIVLLASARGRDEVLPLVSTILERYVPASLENDEMIAGRYVTSLRRAYLNGEETVHSLHMKFSSMYPALGYPEWLAMLSRNCEYATDVPAFLEPFECELTYVASLWEGVKNLNEFKASYSRERSNQHDAF
jgi:hypothetical protein